MELLRETKKQINKGERGVKHKHFSFIFAGDQKVRIIVDSVRHCLSYGKYEANCGLNDSVRLLVSRVILDMLFPLQIPHKDCQGI